MKTLISIDGATRRPGKPDCVASGGFFIMPPEGPTKVAAMYEHNSTNQRGEIHALRAALEYLEKNKYENMEVYIVTDSEYIYNTITKDWISNWANKDWKTADGNPVKHQELWLDIRLFMSLLEAKGNEILLYHVKGHLLSVGKVTGARMLYEDPTGRLLYNNLAAKYESTRDEKVEVFDKALETFNKNHGYYPPPEIFKTFVVMNCVADYVAGTYLDKVLSSK